MSRVPLPGLWHRMHYRVPTNKLVPYLYPEAAEFQAMPAVFATGYLVGLIEWACMQAIHPLLGPGQQSVGTHVNVSHLAATLPGEELQVSVVLREVLGRRLVLDVQVRDESGTIVSAGVHERVLIDRARFEEKLNGRHRRAGRPLTDSR